MSENALKDPIVKALIVEVVASRLVLRALIEQQMPPDQAKAWERLERLAARVMEVAEQGTIEGIDSTTAQEISKIAQASAVAFIRAVEATPLKQ